MTIQTYLSETDKLFEERFELDEVLADGENNELKSFLHERQLGFIELIKGLVPEERKDNWDLNSKNGNILYATDFGFNSCRSQILKNLEK